jgi:hypothetical protein
VSRGYNVQRNGRIVAQHSLGGAPVVIGRREGTPKKKDRKSKKRRQRRTR